MPGHDEKHASDGAILPDSRFLTDRHEMQGRITVILKGPLFAAA